MVISGVVLICRFVFFDRDLLKAVCFHVLEERIVGLEICPPLERIHGVILCDEYNRLRLIVKFLSWPLSNRNASSPRCDSIPKPPLIAFWVSMFVNGSYPICITEA